MYNMYTLAHYKAYREAYSTVVHLTYQGGHSVRHSTRMRLPRAMRDALRLEGSPLTRYHPLNEKKCKARCNISLMYIR